MGHKAIVVGMTVALLVFAHEGAAQEQRTALEQALVAAGMGPGDVVYVTDDDGARVRGDIVELSSGGLTLAVGDGEMGRWATSDVRRVERWDSLRNGVMVGAGVGVTYVGVGCVLSPEECGFVVGYLALPVVAGAAFVGAIVDASRHETVYAAFGSARWRVLPVVRGRSVGAVTSVRW